MSKVRGLSGGASLPALHLTGQVIRPSACSQRPWPRFPSICPGHDRNGVSMLHVGKQACGAEQPKPGLAPLPVLPSRRLIRAFPRRGVTGTVEGRRQAGPRAAPAAVKCSAGVGPPASEQRPAAGGLCSSFCLRRGISRENSSSV